MQYRPYGNTGIQVSALGYGAMRLPAREDKKVDLEQSIPLLQRAIDLGVNYLDSAYGYIDGTSEVAVGAAIKPYDRAKLYLATKIPVHEVENSSEAVWREKLETCLKRFDTPYIDFIHFHGLRWSEFEQVVSKPGMALEAARKAQAEGLVRNICFSSHDTAENIIQLIDTAEFAGMLIPFIRNTIFFNFSGSKILLLFRLLQQTKKALIQQMYKGFFLVWSIITSTIFSTSSRERYEN